MLLSIISAKISCVDISIFEFPGSIHKSRVFTALVVEVMVEGVVPFIWITAAGKLVAGYSLFVVLDVQAGYTVVFTELYRDCLQRTSYVAYAVKVAVKINIVVVDPLAESGSRPFVGGDSAQMDFRTG
jgi:hypothetical protein